MFTIVGKELADSTCTGLSRRDFLKVGGMAAGGLSLTQLLSLEADAGVGNSHKSIINVYLPGGPSHLDLFDLKPEAPAEIRGEFSPIRTNVPGMEISEVFPRLAQMADKFAIVRSLVGSDGLHDCYQCMTGRTRKERAPAGGWPMLGSWVSKVHGPVNDAIPPNLSLMYPTGNRTWGEPGTAGFIGPSHNPMSLVNKDPLVKGDNLRLNMPLERLQDRRGLLQATDQLRRQIDINMALNEVDIFTQKALSILTSSRLVEALDLTQEAPATVAKYGLDDPKYQRDGAPKMVRNFLVARRLVEAGARVVSMNYSRWDWHGGDGMNFPRTREEAPLLDQGLSALISDLHDRGLDRDVCVVVWGEFGRTPKINNRNSRDHWPAVSFALLAGGGMHTGQIIGSTNRLGEHAQDRPVTFQEVFATLYHNIGIDVRSATVQDLQGRPQYLVDAGVAPIAELV
ncbi:MAG: DUF1501 domain-containing protein [Planctomycetales bacterium]|nr:DUF1501 domain-containing protein [Planctomycetales bacterium]